MGKGNESFPFIGKIFTRQTPTLRIGFLSEIFRFDKFFKSVRAKTDPSAFGNQHFDDTAVPSNIKIKLSAENILGENERFVIHPKILLPKVGTIAPYRSRSAVLSELRKILVPALKC